MISMSRKFLHTSGLEVGFTYLLMAYVASHRCTRRAWMRNANLQSWRGSATPVPCPADVETLTLRALPLFPLSTRPGPSVRLHQGDDGKWTHGHMAMRIDVDSSIAVCNCEQDN